MNRTHFVPGEPGMPKDAIRSIQRKLASLDPHGEHGLLELDADYSGQYDSATIEAIQAFQAKNEMTNADGICDEETWRLLDDQAGSTFRESWQFELDNLKGACLAQGSAAARQPGRRGARAPTGRTGLVGRRHSQRHLQPGRAAVAGRTGHAAQVRLPVDRLRRRLYRRMVLEMAAPPGRQDRVDRGRADAGVARQAGRARTRADQVPAPVLELPDAQNRRLQCRYLGAAGNLRAQHRAQPDHPGGAAGCGAGGAAPAGQVGRYGQHQSVGRAGGHLRQVGIHVGIHAIYRVRRRSPRCGRSSGSPPAFRACPTRAGRATCGASARPASSASSSRR